MDDDDTLVEHLDEVFLPPPNPAVPLFATFLLMLALGLAVSLATQVVWNPGDRLVDQPGFWSALSIVGMLIFGLPYCVAAWVQRNRDASAGTEVRYWFLALEYVGWFLAYTLVMGYIGYLPASVLFCTLLVLRAGYRSSRAAIWATVTALAVVVIFKSLLAVKIPGGQIYEALPEALRNFMIQYL